jgi:hypothetical protein
LKTDVVKAIEGSNPSLSVFIQSVPELKGANGQINVHAIARNQRSEAAIAGIVVQSVRAPPCHGGSCGFESRQSRKLLPNSTPLC